MSLIEDDFGIKKRMNHILPRLDISEKTHLDIPLIYVLDIVLLFKISSHKCFSLRQMSKYLIGIFVKIYGIKERKCSISHV